MATLTEKLQAEIARLQEKLQKQAKQKKASKNEWKPPFDGAHRGW